MKKTLSFLASIALCASAWAGPNSAAIKNMHAWCDCVMIGGVCQVSNDTKPRKPGTRVFTSAGPIPAEVWDAYRRDPRMCDNGAKACEESWDGQACRTGYRLMFRQEPMVCVRPGDPVSLSVNK